VVKWVVGGEAACEAGGEEGGEESGEVGGEVGGGVGGEVWVCCCGSAWWRWGEKSACGCGFCTSVAPRVLRLVGRDF
jgi:hypothetical protein